MAGPSGAGWVRGAKFVRAPHGARLVPGFHGCEEKVSEQESIRHKRQQCADIHPVVVGKD